MRFQKLLLCASIAAVVAASANARASNAPVGAVAGAVTAIKAGRLVDVSAGRVRNDQVVLAQDGKITAVGPAAMKPVPPGATLVDLSAQTVLPGLIDTHTHITSATSARAATPTSRCVTRSTQAT